MKYFVVWHAVVPMRRSASEASEMVSQLLFGDMGAILGEQDGFSLVKNNFDSYQGWVDTKMLELLTRSDFAQLTSDEPIRLVSPCAEAENLSDGTVLRLSAGSRLPMFRPTDGEFGFLRGHFRLPTSAETVSQFSSDFTNLAQRARSFLNTPYLWGGKNIFGIDCSGFSQVVFSLVGIALPRDASKQVFEGEEVVRLNDSICGDLAFFEKNGRITHVGILLSPTEIIHASGRVKISAVDEQGVRSDDGKTYTHRFACIRRVLKM